MKQPWTPTIAWIVAVLAALLLALAAPESLGLGAFGFEADLPQGAFSPR